MAEALFKNCRAEVCGQLLVYWTFVVSNYRFVYQVKLDLDFLSKMGTIEEEVNESVFWLEIIIENFLMRKDLKFKLVRWRNW